MELDKNTMLLVALASMAPTEPPEGWRPPNELPMPKWESDLTEEEKAQLADYEAGDNRVKVSARVLKASESLRRHQEEIKLLRIDRDINRSIQWKLHYATRFSEVLKAY